VITAIDAWPGATVTVHARDLSRAVAMRMRHSAVVRACTMRDPCLEEADIVVNATPLGTNDSDPLPVELERLSPTAVVFDLVYAAGETRWVRLAKDEGHVAADGLSMLLHQGAASFERWLGIEPDTGLMWETLRKAAGRD
jgi:shikimate 5-dehydrogenase